MEQLTAAHADRVLDCPASMCQVSPGALSGFLACPHNIYGLQYSQFKCCDAHMQIVNREAMSAVLEDVANDLKGRHLDCAVPPWCKVCLLS